MLFLMIWTFVPVRMTPSVLVPVPSGPLQVLASMLY